MSSTNAQPMLARITKTTTMPITVTQDSSARP
eukprot:CAMPEP_0119116374 /NCGR_PEP_ID=MMETSP1180-20130426/52245_1 /TAXON_ID=3052 ORGANISM="Chlamydomonas cf sp, Strain CCMP681" /NCGR_SAMPLE_ID=MMETSP1180 /ASSEMBLY_ACC=CAM_ASM_000741 /LENGTH=31 /DNA_ID= /DNA_START= /DNA_END= /DNA_ORIENTATION=